MSSIQERLQLKRVPLDTWNIREQLCLASAVVRSGDQNWMSVSRALKTIGEPNRPPDWYSQKSCAAQYGTLLEHVETPKRKKRSSEGAGETPQESILKRLTQDRINEIQSTVNDMNQQYEQLKNEISEVRNPTTSEERLKEIWANIEANKRAQERDNARRAALMKEREERRARVARSPRGSLSNEAGEPTASPAPAPPSSPLLTSLLKSSPVVTTPQHITHPAKLVDSVSPSVTAPTLSMLLEKSTPQQDSKRAAIEHIKSQLVQIEQQLKANTPPSPAPLAPTPAPPPAALDIDDIEINAEDVYVFRDVDIHIPNVHNQHGQDKAAEKPVVVKKDEEENVEIEVETVAPTQEEVVVEKEEPPINVEEIKKETPVHVETTPAEESTEEKTVKEEETSTNTEDNIKLAFPEVKFPTTEIKVIPPDEQKIKEENKEAEAEAAEESVTEAVTDTEIVEEPTPAVDSVEQQMSDMHAESTPPRSPSPAPAPPEEEETTLAEEKQEEKEEELSIQTSDIPLPPEPEITAPEQQVQAEPETVPPEPEAPPAPEVVEEKPEVAPAQAAEEVVEEKAVEELKREDDAEDSIPLQQMIRDESLRHIIKEETHTETDDDTPMELSREEEKDGKKKRDYSRKKKPDSRTCSGSESAAEASAPESPHASDADRQHRLWKKAVMLVYSRLCAHKYASLFLRPISDEEAPGYSVVVRRPMDLSTIRRNIDSGALRTTSEFQRDVLLMLSNALMYNSSEHSVYTMAKEMHEEVVSQLGVLLAAQAHAALEEEPPSRRKRRRTNDPRAHAHRPR